MVYDFGSCSLNRRCFRTFAIVLDIKRIFRTSVGRSRYRNMFKNIWQQLFVLEPAYQICQQFSVQKLGSGLRRLFRLDTCQQLFVLEDVLGHCSSFLYQRLFRAILLVVHYTIHCFRSFVMQFSAHKMLQDTCNFVFQNLYEDIVQWCLVWKPHQDIS